MHLLFLSKFMNSGNLGSPLAYMGSAVDRQSQQEQHQEDIVPSCERLDSEAKDSLPM